jgi:hypothetical protein
MRNADEILQFVLTMIGHIYYRPLMYGGNAHGVEIALSNYHLLWAEIVERQEELRAVEFARITERRCCTRAFSNHYRRHARKGCSEAEAAQAAVEEWKRIDRELGIVVPLSAAATDLEPNPASTRDEL